MLKKDSPIVLQNINMIARQLFLLFKKSTTFWDNPRIQGVAYQLPRLGKRELICLLSFTCTCNYVVSVRRGFLFLLVLGVGCFFFIVALPGPAI